MQRQQQQQQEMEQKWGQYTDCDCIYEALRQQQQQR